jgi:hypothetical protein
VELEYRSDGKQPAAERSLSADFKAELLRVRIEANTNSNTVLITFSWPLTR